MSIGENTAAGNQLKALAERMERLLDEIDGLKDDLKDLKGEAKNAGFNVDALTKLVAIRRNKQRAVRETEMLNDLILYAHATGTPLDVIGVETAAPEPLPSMRPTAHTPVATTFGETAVNSDDLDEGDDQNR